MDERNEHDTDAMNQRMQQSWKLYDCKCATIEFLSKYIKDYESKILWVIISTLTVIGGLLIYIINYLLSNLVNIQISLSNIELTFSKNISLATVIVILLLLCLIGYKIVLLYLDHCRSSMENHIEEIDSCVIKVIPEFAAQFLLIRIESMKKTLKNIDKSLMIWKRWIVIGLASIFVFAVIILSIQIFSIF